MSMSGAQARSALLLLLMTLLAACSRPSTLEKVRQEKVLHVITRSSPITYYEDKDGPAGFEYELSKRLADHLEVDLRVRVVDSLEQIYRVTEDAYTDFASVGASSTAARERQSGLRFSEPFITFTPVVIYRKGKTRPQAIEDLLQRHVVVPAHTAQATYLEKRREEGLPGLDWQLMEDIETPELLRMVDAEEVDLAIVNSTEFAIHNGLFPKLRAGFELMPAQEIRWVFPPGDDTSLLDVTNSFLTEARDNGTLSYLEERYYGHVGDFDYVGARTFIKHIHDRLPKYESTFRAAADKFSLDWRLLAAIGYQESHWRPYATSPTGVRGLMMLTLDTARYMGVKNRLDPDESIWGGAGYFSRTYDRLPDSIQEPHRTWMALAAYNVGYGHLMDARRITESQGYNPDIWQDVKRHLPLLQQKQWYKYTRYGYARGWEPVHYVQNIRRYFDVLIRKLPGAEEPDSDSSGQETQVAGSLSRDLPGAFRFMPPIL